MCTCAVCWSAKVEKTVSLLGTESETIIKSETSRASPSSRAVKWGLSIANTVTMKIIVTF